MFWVLCQLPSYIYTAHLCLLPLPLLLSTLLHGSWTQSWIPQSSPTYERWYCIISEWWADWMKWHQRHLPTMSHSLFICRWLFFCLNPQHQLHYYSHHNHTLSQAFIYCCFLGLLIGFSGWSLQRWQVWAGMLILVSHNVDRYNFIILNIILDLYHIPGCLKWIIIPSVNSTYCFWQGHPGKYVTW